jgi:predicted PurR-regulated permease PerM
MLEKKITFDSFVRGALTAAIVVALFWLLDHLSSVLLPFFIAWLVAYFMYPLVKFYQYRLRMKNRVIAILSAMLTVVIVLTLASIFFVPSVMEEFVRLKDLLMQYFVQGSRNATIPGTVENFIKENIDWNYLQQFFSEENLANTLKSLMPKVWSILHHSVSFVIGILASFIILLYIFFILLDYESIANGWIKLVPARHRDFVQAIAMDVEISMNRYFRGQALVAFLVGVLFSIGFLLIDFPLAIGFGLFIGLLNMVPYLQLVALVPTILLALLKAADTGQNFWVILALAMLVFGVVQLIQDGFIVPKVMGKITGLNPAVILLSLSIWGSLLGILGMIIALPMTTLILAYYRQFLHYDERISPPETLQEKTRRHKRRRSSKKVVQSQSMPKEGNGQKQE